MIAAPEELTFPDGFLWGTATASHQVEGGNTGNDWWRFEHQPGRIRGGDRSGDAAGWWTGRAEGDLAEAVALGQNAHRLSLEWSRLEPTPDAWDDDACARYREILGAARDLGLTTCVTVHHFSLPLWAADRGSWLWPDLADRLGSFAARAAAELGDLVDLWVTINEPNILALFGYAEGRFPPGQTSLLACFRALRNMLRGHVAARRAIQGALGPDAQVGLVANLPLFEPARPASRLDRFAAAFQDWCMSGALLHGLRTGRLLPPLGTGGHVAGLRGAVDFFGLNYYGRFAVRFDPFAPAPLGRHVQEPSIRLAAEQPGQNDADWGQPCARGIRRQLRRLATLGVPLYVTENGVFDNDDTLRPQFLVDHLREVALAIDEGVDVRGYFHWSLVDNFEWAEGWATHFGLLALDPDDRAGGARTRRQSAGVYAEICRRNAVPSRDASPAKAP